MEDLVLDILSNVAKEMNLRILQIENTIKLFDEGNIPPWFSFF